MHAAMHMFIQHIIYRIMVLSQSLEVHSLWLHIEPIMYLQYRKIDDTFENYITSKPLKYPALGAGSREIK